MNDKKWVHVAKHMAYIAVLVLLYVLQTTPGFLTVFGVKPNFVIPAAICVAFHEGEFVGGLYGALAGILCDLSGFTLFGFNSIITLACCVAAGLLVIYLLRPTVVNFVLLVFAALLARGLLEYLFNYWMWGYDNVWMVLVYNTIPTVLYSTAASPLVFYLLAWVSGRFEKRLQS